MSVCWSIFWVCGFICCLISWSFNINVFFLDLDYTAGQGNGNDMKNGTTEQKQNESMDKQHGDDYKGDDYNGDGYFDVNIDFSKTVDKIQQERLEEMKRLIMWVN